MRPLCQSETASPCQDDACVAVVWRFSCLSVAPICALRRQSRENPTLS